MTQVNKINAAEFATLNMALTGVDASKKYVVYNGFTYKTVEYRHEKNLSTRNLTQLAQSAFAFVEDSENGTPSAVKHNYKQLEQSVSSLVNRLESHRLESRRSFFYRLLEFFGFTSKEDKTFKNDHKILKDIVQKTKERLNILETETTEDTNPTTPQDRMEILFDNWKQMSDFNRQNGTLNKELKQFEKNLMNDNDFLAMLSKIIKVNKGNIPINYYSILDPICDNLDKVRQYNAKFGGFEELLKKLEKRNPWEMSYEFRTKLELSDMGQTFQAIIPAENGSKHLFEFTNTGPHTFTITYSKSENTPTLMDVITPIHEYASVDSSNTLGVFHNVKLDHKVGYGWFRDLFTHHSPRINSAACQII